jgi:hypothetical protein
MILLFSHVRTGRWASVMPAKLAETLGLTDTLRAFRLPEARGDADHRLVVQRAECLGGGEGGGGGDGSEPMTADHRRRWWRKSRSAAKTLDV